jgi:nucleoside-diphosphate-sugar epimerase
MRKALVTGCCGYIGSHLVGHLLRDGFRVVGVDSLLYPNCRHGLMANLGRFGFEFHRADAGSAKTLALAAGCDVVFPLAAVVGAPACDSYRDHASRTNSEAVRRLVGHLSPSQFVLYPNTNSGYGAAGREVTEDDPLSPVSHYGLTKLDGEKAVLDHPNSVSLRLATVFGASPRMRLDLMVNDFASKLVTGGRLKVFEPHASRNYVHVQDVCRAFMMMARVGPSSLEHRVYNVGNHTLNMTKFELAWAVCDVLGLARDLVSVGEGADPDRRDYVVSNKRLLMEGFSFLHGLAEGVREVELVCLSHSADQLREMRNT